MNNPRTGAAPDINPAPLVDFADVTKRFGPTVALDSVSLAGWAGTVHAITGENGAGKSTLMNLLGGVHTADAGQIRLRNSPLVVNSPRESHDAGISTIFQELTLLPNLTVAENMFLGREQSGFGIVDRAQMRREARAALDRLGSSIGVNQYCSELSVGEQQIVEIARGMMADADVFIFDEPTAALNAPEVEKLAELIGSMKADGKLVFYISHRLDEIFRFCDTVSVLKDGRHVATRPTGELDHDSLVSLMVGRALGDLYPERGEFAQRPEAALSVSGLQAAAGWPEISFDLLRGEILGLAGLEGQGQRAIIRSLAGLEKPAAGTIVKREPATGAETRLGSSIVATTRAGIGFVPEDRKTEGLYLPLSISRNMALGTFRSSRLWRLARFSKDEIENLVLRMRVQASGLAQPVGSLSGGNQQKVMIGRWLASKVDILLIEEPTRGVDVGAKAEIYRLLRDFADAGGSVLFTSSELTEILGLSTRILVVRGGALAAEFDGAQATEEQVTRAALSGSGVQLPEAAA